MVGVLLVDTTEVFGARQEQVEQVGIEMFSAFFYHQVTGVFEVKRRFIHPGRGQGVEVVGNRSNPALDGNVYTLQVTRITGAVVAFVMSPGDESRHFEQF